MYKSSKFKESVQSSVQSKDESENRFAGTKNFLGFSLNCQEFDCICLLTT